MVVLNRIYTRTADKGETGLVDGSRLPKDAPRVAAYGTVDELNATLGLARLHAEGLLAAGIERVQNDLFDLGADLATPGFEHDAEAKHTPLRIVAAQVDRLEREIDAMNVDLAPLRSFILPGGTALAAHLHLARTVCRRAEREAVSLATASINPEVINPEAVRYLNRLSDWLFVAARIANDSGKSDILWVPGANR